MKRAGFHPLRSPPEVRKPDEGGPPAAREASAEVEPLVDATTGFVDGGGQAASPAQLPPDEAQFLARKSASYYDQLVRLGHAEDVSVLKHAEPQIREFLAGLPANSLIVDAGAGDGDVDALAVAAGHRTIGVEISHEMSKAFEQRRLAGSTVVGGDARLLPIDDAKANAAISSFVLIHLDRRGGIAALRELRRVLVPGAAALVATNVKLEGSEDVPYAHRAVRGEVAPTDFHFWNRADLLDQVEAAGFVIVRCLDTDHFKNGRPQVYLTLRAV